MKLAPIDMAGLRRGHPTVWRFRHCNAAGNVIWASGVGDLSDDPIVPGSKRWLELFHDQPYSLNVLTALGDDEILELYFRAGTAPTTFYMGLANSTIVEGSTLANITEVANGSYARQEVPRSSGGFPSAVTDGVATTSTETFTASGGTLGPATDAFLCTNAATGTSGALICGNALSTSRTLADTETLDVDIAITLD
jgi:hypothetical protein